jgi:hypothetical protein
MSIDAHPEYFPLESVPVADFPSYAGASLDEATVHRSLRERRIVRVSGRPRRVKRLGIRLVERRAPCEPYRQIRVCQKQPTKGNGIRFG